MYGKVNKFRGIYACLSPSYKLQTLLITINIIMRFTAKIDSEKLNDDEIDDRMLADRLLL